MIIGRQKELDILNGILKKNEARFLAIYGRRRVGKTFLIREFFPEHGNFLEIVGQKKASNEVQLKNFTSSYSSTYLNNAPLPDCKTWQEAFQVLTKQIEKQDPKIRQVLFFDELPWLGDECLDALDYAWNAHWSKNNNIILIVCGSAASWMMRKVINAKGGLYNRITDLLHLKPFDFIEFKQFLENLGIRYPLFNLVELYLAVGGIPHYLKLLEKGLSVSQNIDQLFFNQNPRLKDEYDRLFEALFGDSKNHYAVMQALSKSRKGLSRKGIKDNLGIASSTLHQVIEELELSAFIKSNTPFGNKKRDTFYNICDPYCMFYLKWIEPTQSLKKNESYWFNVQQSSSWNSWAGYSFEWFCEEHYQYVLKALGISGIQSTTSKWRFKGSPNQELDGSEIDLIIDRADNLINTCEIKFTRTPFIADKSYIKNLNERLAIFKEVTKTKKSIVPILISASGALDNSYLKENFQYNFSLEDLFP